jgi:hypothetical protein
VFINPFSYIRDEREILKVDTEIRHGRQSFHSHRDDGAVLYQEPDDSILTRATRERRVAIEPDSAAIPRGGRRSRLPSRRETGELRAFCGKLAGAVITRRVSPKG